MQHHANPFAEFKDGGKSIWIQGFFLVYMIHQKGQVLIRASYVFVWKVLAFQEMEILKVKWGL